MEDEDETPPAYRIIKADDTSELQGLVNTLIAEGYKPIGGLVRTTGQYYQAMFNG